MALPVFLRRDQNRRGLATRVCYPWPSSGVQRWCQKCCVEQPRQQTSFAFLFCYPESGVFWLHDRGRTFLLASNAWFPQKKNARGLLGQRVSWRQVRPHPFPTHSRFPEPRIENFTFIKQPQWFQPVCCKGPSVFNCPKCTGAGRRLPGVSANPWS